MRLSERSECVVIFVFDKNALSKNESNCKSN